jgi:hypothetical protein
MNSEKCSQVVSAGKGLSQIGLPLPLLLDVADDLVGVGSSHLDHVAVQLSEVPGQFQGQPLQVVDTFEASKLGDVCRVHGPTRVIRIHKVVMLLEEGDQPMPFGEDHAIDR